MVERDDEIVIHGLCLMRPVYNNILNYFFRSSKKYPIELVPKKRPIRGRILYSYLDYSLLWDDENVGFDGHSNRWESREIARVFLSLGYAVDAISFKDNLFVPQKKYDVIFDISTNLQRLAPLLPSQTVKIIHRTGSDAFYQNNAEMQRVTALESRKKKIYAPKRIVAYPDLERKSLKIADGCTLLGNRHTLSTYPDKYHSKMKLVPVSASVLDEGSKKLRKHIPAQREFLFFSGSGMVHKGLDLVLDVFAKNTQYTLHIVGCCAAELDFMKIYNKELTSLINIQLHGFLCPKSFEFKNILNKSFCFIAPFCSEATSTSAATCLQAGLYPILSKDTGVSLPDGCGVYLNSCSTNEIECAVQDTIRLSDNILIDQIQRIQREALRQFSRENFREIMEKKLTEMLL